MSDISRDEFIKSKQDTRPAPSPLPWTTDKLSIRDAKVNSIAYLGHTFGPPEQSEANSDLIIKAVNSYATHLALIEEQQELLRRWFSTLKAEDINAFNIQLVKGTAYALAKSRAVLGGGGSK